MAIPDPTQDLLDSASYAKEAQRAIATSQSTTTDSHVRNRALAEAQVWSNLSIGAAIREMIEVYVAATAGR